MGRLLYHRAKATVLMRTLRVMSVTRTLWTVLSAPVTSHLKLPDGRTTDETVANANDSFDAVSAVAKFLSQPSYVNIERARIAVIAVTPNVVQ